MHCNIWEDQNPQTQKQWLICNSLLRLINFFVASSVIRETKANLSEVQTLSTCCVTVELNHHRYVYMLTYETWKLKVKGGWVWRVFHVGGKSGIIELMYGAWTVPSSFSSLCLTTTDLFVGKWSHLLKASWVLMLQVVS
jgi:hypothetical protein